MKIPHLALAFTAVLLAGCNLDSGNRASVPPSFAIVNAATRTVGMNLHVDANDPINNIPLAPRQVDPGCPFILNGEHTFDWVQGDTVYSTVQGTLILNHTYLVTLVDAVVNNDTTYRTIVAGDDLEQAPAGSNGIRLINGTSSAGDVYVTGINEDPSAATKVASNLPPAATAATLDLSFHMRPETASRVRLFDVGATTNPRSDILLTDTDLRGLTTVIFMPHTQPAQGGVQVNVCN